MRKFIVYILMTSTVLSSCVVSKIEPPETTEIEEETTERQETKETKEIETESVENIDDLSKYNPFGYPTAIMQTSGKGAKWVFLNYDDDGNLTEIRRMYSDEDSFIEKEYRLMTYDEKGRLLSASSGKKKGMEKYCIRCKYTDEENRKETFNYYDGELSSISNEIYDDDGEVIEFKNYDADGNLSMYGETRYPEDIEGVDKITITRDYSVSENTQIEYHGEQVNGRLVLYHADYLNHEAEYDSLSFDYEYHTENADGNLIDYYIDISGFIDDEYRRQGTITALLREKTAEPGKEMIYIASANIEGKRNIDRYVKIEGESFSINKDEIEALLDVKSNANTINIKKVDETGAEISTGYYLVLDEGDSVPDAESVSEEDKLDIEGKTYIKYVETIVNVNGGVTTRSYSWNDEIQDIWLDVEYYHEYLVDEAGNEISSKDYRKYHGAKDDLYVSAEIMLREYSENNKVIQTKEYYAVVDDGVFDCTDASKYEDPSLDSSIFYDFMKSESNYKYICDSKGREIITISDTCGTDGTIIDGDMIEVSFADWLGQLGHELISANEFDIIDGVKNIDEYADGRVISITGENNEMLIFYPESAYVGVVEQ